MVAVKSLSSFRRVVRLGSALFLVWALLGCSGPDLSRSSVLIEVFDVRHEAIWVDQWGAEVHVGDDFEPQPEFVITAEDVESMEKVDWGLLVVTLRPDIELPRELSDYFFRVTVQGEALWGWVVGPLDPRTAVTPFLSFSRFPPTLVVASQGYSIVTSTDVVYGGIR